MTMEEKEKAITAKDAEISRLQSELEGSRAIRPQSADTHSEQHYSRPRSILDTE